MLAAMVAVSDELLQRVPLARAELVEDVSRDDSAIPRPDSRELAVEATGDDIALSRIDSSQLVTQDEAQSAGLSPQTDDLALARALDTESAAAVVRLRELMTGPGTEDAADEMSRI